jgi:hypothetical protein
VREVILVQVETWDSFAEPYAKAWNLIRLFSQKVDEAGRRSRLRQHIGFGYGKVISIDEVRSVTL